MDVAEDQLGTAVAVEVDNRAVAVADAAPADDRVVIAEVPRGADGRAQLRAVLVGGDLRTGERDGLLDVVVAVAFAFAVECACVPYEGVGGLVGMPVAHRLARQVTVPIRRRTVTGR